MSVTWEQSGCELDIVWLHLVGAERQLRWCVNETQPAEDDCSTPKKGQGAIVL